MHAHQARAISTGQVSSFVLSFSSKRFLRAIKENAAMNMRKRLLGSGAAVLAVGAMFAAPVAQAASRHTVLANVPKPQAACGNVGSLPAGSWLANKPCGYIVGWAMAGSTFDNHLNSASNFHYGRTYQSGGANFCAWALPSSLGSSTSTVADSCSTATKDSIVHRLAIGRDFDNEPGVGNGTITIPVNASGCAGYYNYFNSSSYGSGYFHDPVGFAPSATSGYRYASNDLNAAMIRSDSGGETTWMFVDRSCIAAQIAGYPLSNTND